jgi:hypothetical protein
MLSDAVKYWLAIAAIMLLMWGYSGRIATALLFGVAAAGAFVYWRLSVQQRKRATHVAQRGDEHPRGA